MKKLKKIIVLVVFLLPLSISLFGCGSQNVNSGIDFYQIVSEIVGYDVSEINVPYYFSIGKDNSYCEIDTNPYDLSDYSSKEALGYISEMNNKLNLPEYVLNEMLHTSYSQGKQTATFNNISVTWYYHPNKGLNCMYKII